MSLQLLGQLMMVTGAALLFVCWALVWLADRDATRATARPLFRSLLFVALRSLLWGVSLGALLAAALLLGAGVGWSFADLEYDESMLARFVAGFVFVSAAAWALRVLVPDPRPLADWSTPELATAPVPVSSGSPVPGWFDAPEVATDGAPFDPWAKSR